MTKPATERCPSMQFALSYDWRARNPAGTCAVCGKHVRATKSGHPYRHNRVVQPEPKKASRKRKSITFSGLVGERITRVDADLYGSYIDIETASGKELRIGTGRSGAHNETWSTVTLTEREKAGS